MSWLQRRDFGPDYGPLALVEVAPERGQAGQGQALVGALAARGALYRQASGSILLSRIQMTTLMLRTFGDLGNVDS